MQTTNRENLQRPARCTGEITVRIRPLTVAALAAVVSLALLAPTAGAASWSGPSLLENPSGMSVSCASSSACTAAGGHLAFAFNGSHWSRGASIDPGGAINAISCPTKSFCVAVDNRGDALSFNGSRWSAPVKVDHRYTGLEDVSCAGPNACVAVDLGGDAWTWNGRSWLGPVRVDPRSAHYAVNYISVSCPTTSFCAVADGFGNVIPYNGGRWGKPQHVIDTDSGFHAISCASASFCVAIGDQAATYANGKWTAAPLSSAATDLLAVSCSAVDSCDGIGSDAHYSFDGHGWHRAGGAGHPGDSGAIDSLSCPAAGVCVGTNDSGTALALRSGRWHSTSLQPLNHDQGLGAVSCATARFCTVFDQGGDAWTLTGRGRSRPVDPFAKVGGATGGIGAVSCPDVGFCAVTDGIYAVARIHGRWGKPSHFGSDTPQPADGEVACSRSRFCVAVDNNFHTAVLRHGRWHRAHRYPDLAITSLSCASSSFCVAAGGGEESTFNGRHWSRPRRIDRHTSAGDDLEVSCPTTRFCAAADQTGYALTFNGKRWSSPRRVDRGTFSRPNNKSVFRVSCASSRDCIAVDARGRTLTWNGRRWTRPRRFDHTGYAPAGLSCTSGRFCMAIDDGGYTLTRR